MDCYLIKRPGSDATVSYGYKTDVLASYGNKEDRIAQRDTPRIGFSYSFMISDLKTALALDRELQNAGNAGTIWAPDWTAFENIGTVRSGTNTYVPVSGITNFADGQEGVLYVNDNLWTVVTVNVIHNELVFESTVEYDNALLLPLYACDMTGEPEITQANSLCYTLSVTLEVKRPEFSPVSEWGVKYQGHDVWAGFKVSEDSGIVVRKPEQEVQENDYDIGVRDRFTFFERMYDSFGTTAICEQSELPAFRNFIKRRYGKTYSFFMASGAADFQKAGSAGDTVGSYLRIRNNQHDFSARPYIVIQTDETANYAHVIALQDDWGDPVGSDYSGEEFITLVLEESFSFKYKDIDSVQILYFVRLNDDEVSFGCIGNSGGEKPVYSVDLSMIETDFYDASLIDYEDTWGSAKDLNTIYLFKVVNGEPVLENGAEHGFSLVKNSGWESAITAGRREGTYAVSNNSSSGSWLILPVRTERASVIGKDDDFVFQIEGRFTEEGSYTLMQTNLYSANICARIFRSDGYCWMEITGTRAVFVKMNRWLGDEFGWHEWALQRHNGRLYFLCDGLLCGTSDDLKGEEWGGTTEDEGIVFASGSANVIVQQFRLAKGLNVYSGETDTVNDEYRLNHYSLNKLRAFDNATVCIFDFKHCRQAHTAYTIVSGYYSYENRECTWDFATGDSERIRRSNESIVNSDPGSSQSYNYDSITGLRITSGSNSIWAIHPNIVLEENYHHDFWFEFTMVISDDQPWSEQIIFPLPGLMVTAKISSGEYTIEGFGLASGVYVNIGAAITFAACLDSRNNRICTYVNGHRTGMTTITAFMQTNKDGMISLYPLAIRRPQDCDAREYYLHRLRIVEKCLTSDASYTVENEWTLGAYYTVPFAVEYGTRNSSDTKILEIKNIESVHPFAPYFTTLKQSQTALRCNKLWSDGGRKTEVISPAERTLYTVILTDPKTGIQGYGWYYVYPSYDGIYYKSILTKKQNVTENFITQTVPIIRGERYVFEEQKKEIYKPAVVPIEYFEVVSPFDEIEYNRIGNSLHFTRATNGGADFLSGDGTLPTNGAQIPAVSRWGTERRIRQIEFVLNPPFIPYFYGSDASGTYRYSFYNTRVMQYHKVYADHDDASEIFRDAGTYTYFGGEQSQFVTVKSGCPYWTQWREKRNHYGYCCQGSSGSAIQYDPNETADPKWIRLNDMMYMEPKKPIHVAVQFCFAALSYYVDAWNKYNRIFQMPEKIWIEGVEYKIPEQWWNQYKDKFNSDKTQITLSDICGETEGIQSLFVGAINDMFYDFMVRKLSGIGGLFAYDGNNLWTNHIACMKAYENEHYRGDFDSDAVMAKLEDERVDWIYWGE